MRFPRLFSLSLLLLFALGTAVAEIVPPKRLACVGDSITFGSGIEWREYEAYPMQLQRMLGTGWVVQNFGVSGSTLLKKGNRPYQAQPAFERALKSSPDVVLIMLGTNDTKPDNWKVIGDFEADYLDLIGRFKSLPSHPRVILARPPPVVGGEAWGINEKGVLELIPVIDRIAAAEGLDIVDQHAVMIPHPELIPDHVHPNTAGAELMARAAFRTLTGKDYVGSVPSYFTDVWHGHQRINFKANNRWSILVRPSEPTAGCPWIWRTEFFGVEPQADLALLALGWHIAWTDLNDLYGAPEAMGRMDAFHAHVVSEYKLSSRPVLEGFSRGGLPALRWAGLNPSKVAALYLDAPVCDVMSWPAGKGTGKSSPQDWTKLLKAYGTDEAGATALGPLSHLKPIADAKIPILCVVGDADKTVPFEENTALLEKQYRVLGGPIDVIHKPGADHHPHSLKDPKPIVDFLLWAR